MLSRRDLFALAVGALAVRLAHLVFLWASGTGFLIEDSSLYLWNADWLARTGEFLTGTLDAPRPETERMYGYVTVVAVLGWLFGEGQVAATLLLQVAADTISVLCIACAAARLGRRTGLIAGALAALWPNMVQHSGLILADTLALSLMCVAMLGFIRSAEAPGWGRALQVGIALGSSLAIRQGFLPLVPLIALLMGWLAWRAGGGELPRPRALSRVVTMALIPVVLTGLFLTPQVERHRERTDRIVLTSQAGTHLLFWVAAEATSDLKGGTRADWVKRFGQEVAARVEALPEAPDAFGLSDIRTDIALEKLGALPAVGLARVWGRAGIVNLFAPSIAFHPWVRAQKTESFDREATGGGLVGQVRGFLAGQPAVYLTAVLPAMAAAATIALFAAAGLIVTFRRYPGMTLIGVGFVTYVLILIGPVIGAKYALPADPVLIVWTAAGLVWAARAIAPRRGEENLP